MMKRNTLLEIESNLLINFLCLYPIKKKKKEIPENQSHTLFVAQAL